MRNPSHREILSRVPRELQRGYPIKQLAADTISWGALLLLNLNFSGVVAGAISSFGFAVLSFRAFGMMHECVHSSGASNRRINNVFGTVYGVLCFLPFKSWQRVHLDHHIWTGNVEKDPSMGLLLRFRNEDFTLPKYVSWSWLHWVPTLALLQHIVFWRAIRGWEKISVLGSITFIAGCIWMLGSIPTFAGIGIYLYMVEIINFPHHLELRQFKGETRFSASEQAQFARSCIYPKWFARHVLLNFNLHTEHHLFPAHPWYQLEKLREELKSRGLILNECQGNEWILNNRSIPIENVFMKTFEKDREEKAA